MPKKETYLLAKEFQKTKLWERMYDSELFAIQAPDGQLGYCCVMGRLGEHFALAVYPGDAGLASYRGLQEGPDDDLDGLALREHMMSQDCIVVSFEKKAELESYDAREVGAYGLSFRGKNAYPLFRRMKPRRPPWFLLDEADEAMLKLALEAGLEVASKVPGDTAQQDMFHPSGPETPKEALGLAEGPAYDRAIPLLIKNPKGEFDWSMVQLPPLWEPAYPSPKLADDLFVRRLRQKKPGGVWDCAIFMFPNPAMEGDADSAMLDPGEGNGPFFPLMLLVVDHKTGLVRHQELSGQGTPEAEARMLIESLARYMQESERPQTILTCDARSHAMLSAFAEQIKVRLSLKAELPMLRDTKDSLMEYFDEESPEADGENEIAALSGMLDDLLSAPAGEVPDEMLGQLAKILQVDLPQDILNKIQRVLRKHR